MIKKENKIEDVSANEEIISKKEVDLNLPQIKQPIHIRTLNVMINPLKKRHEKHYKESKKHLVLDLIFVFLIVLLILSNIILFTKTKPKVLKACVSQAYSKKFKESG